MNSLAFVVLSYVATSLAIQADYGFRVEEGLTETASRASGTAKSATVSRAADAPFNDAYRYAVKPADFNSSGMDFSPCGFRDGIVFVSSRSKKGVVQPGEASFLNLFYTAEGADGSFSQPEPMNSANISSYHEGPAAFCRDGTRMIFTRNAFIRKSKVRDGSVNPLELAQSDMTAGGKWSEPVTLSFADQEYSVAHPALNSDGSILYFSSNMPGSLGQSDIFVTHFQNGAWTTPQNMGPSINTSGQELFPYVYRDSLLFFSSSGHQGLGGLDIFFCRLSDPQRNVYRMEAPVNSSADDFGIYVERGAASGFFSSNREGGVGEDDIYSFEEIQPFAEIQLFDSLTRSFVQRATVTVNDAHGSRVLRTDLSGRVAFRMRPLYEYKISVSAYGYESKALAVGAASPQYSKGAALRVYLQPLTSGDNENHFAGVQTRDRAGLTNVISFSSSPLDVDLNESLTDEGIPETEDSVSDRRLRVIVVEIINGLPGILLVRNDSLIELKKISEFQLESKEFNLTIEIPHGAKRHVYEEIIRKQVLAQGHDIEKFLLIRSFFFDSGKAWVRNDASAQLDKIVEVMMIHPALDLQMTFHSDSRGTERFNLDLSKARAQEVSAYLLKAGVTRDRIVTEFVGEGQLLNDCGDLADCDELLHQINRTAEFKLIIR